MGYYIYGFDTLLTYGLIIIAFIIVTYAQHKITSSYKTYNKIINSKRISGCEVARKILDTNGLNDVYVVAVGGQLTDHYDPTRKTVRLSQEVFDGTTIASLSIAAHECGHAIQDKEGYFMMRLRSMLVPIVNIISYLGYFGIVVSLFAGLTGYLKLSILILVATLVFQLVTLPVEFDASKRALKQLEKLNLVNNSENYDCEVMLRAAALTYVAGLISTLLNLLRLIIILKGNDDDR